MSIAIPRMQPEHPWPEPSSVLMRLSRLFSESLMGFLALVALATATGPLAFDVGPGGERALTALEWVLVGTFAAEFFVQGAVAHDRRAWIRSPWRIVDALTVLGPIVALMPQVSDVARGSLILRMLRVGRAVAFGTRAGSVAVRRPRNIGQAVRTTTPTFKVVVADGDLHGVGSNWDSFLTWTRQPAGAWFHASNLDANGFHQVAHAARLSNQEIGRVFEKDGHAQLRESAHYATLILQMPTVAEVGFPKVDRDRIVAVVKKEGILTATTSSFDLHATVEQLSKGTLLPTLPFPVRIACALLSVARDRNLFIAHRFDEEVRGLEALEGGNVFLRETFRLRREISATAIDLWHVKGIVRALASGNATLGGVDLKEEKHLDDLLAEMESLYETVNKSNEEVKTLIELHINFKSFETNAFLKLLAVVSFLGLIPSVAGGLLGMNLLGNPWPFTLGQVAFGVAMTMATALYVFAVKGWLR